MNGLKVVHGNPSQEELAAVVTVLLSLTRQDTEPEGGPARRPSREVRWSRGGRAYPAPAGSWKFAS
ncbi:acyl-CoA carboxylase subunit epsilon [Streptomyces sp. NPDC093568]|uniref:acyl-CoA carboxylase subunit epsilon n=1 Tax=Streptomyces sp. NPDC093568 TaxID=3366041 RepID=UPI003805B233